MTFHEYENEIKDTLAKYIRDKAQKERYVELILGLYEEGAEVTSIIRRSIPGNFHETQIDLTHLEEELGDIIWYISQIRMQLHSDNKFNAEEISLEGQGDPLEHLHKLRKLDSGREICLCPLRVAVCASGTGLS